MSEPHTDRTTMEALLSAQQQAFKAEGPVSYETRIDRLNRCLDLLVDHQDKICEAVNSDFGSRSRHVTLMTDIFTSVHGVKFVKSNLKKWMKKRKVNGTIIR